MKMLKPEQIVNAKFTPVSKGTYSAEEVDAFLKTVASEYEKSLAEKAELIKKISILADKIESYRSDEEARKREKQRHSWRYRQYPSPAPLPRR